MIDGGRAWFKGVKRDTGVGTGGASNSKWLPSSTPVLVSSPISGLVVKHKLARDENNRKKI
jgi:hypothetical protein